MIYADALQDIIDKNRAKAQLIMEMEYPYVDLSLYPPVMQKDVYHWRVHLSPYMFLQVNTDWKEVSLHESTLNKDIEYYKILQKPCMERDVPNTNMLVLITLNKYDTGYAYTTLYDKTTGEQLRSKKESRIMIQENNKGKCIRVARQFVYLTNKEESQ